MVQALKKLSKTTYTNETCEEYEKLPKEQQDKIKDVGGFVGGTLIGERRRRDTVESRSLIILDADFGCPNLWEVVKIKLPYACCIYSTHDPSKQRE